MAAFTPLDPGYARRVQDSFASQAFLNTLNARLSSLQPGEVEITAPFDPRWGQQDGFLHAGVAAALVDTACGYAAHTLMPPAARVLTVEFKINLLSPALGERFLARGTVVKPGRTLTVCEGRLFAHQGQAAKLVAAMQATMICVLEHQA